MCVCVCVRERERERERETDRERERQRETWSVCVPVRGPVLTDSGTWRCSGVCGQSRCGEVLGRMQEDYYFTGKSTHIDRGF